MGALRIGYRIPHPTTVILVCTLMLVIPAGCRHRDFAKLGTVTSINIVGKDRLPIGSKITKGQSISMLVDFVDSQKVGWTTPLAGVPVPVVVAEFYDGNTFKGHFGVGKRFFETQRDGGFFSKDASPEDVRHFLDLVGIKEEDVDR